MTHFTDMNLAPPLLKALELSRIVKPTEIQAQAIPVALEGKDLIAVAETGSGKTLAYLLPVVTRLLNNPNSRALVLSPTRETAEQIHRVLISLCSEVPLKIGVAITGTPMADQIKELKKNPRLIVATPGRLQEHLQGNKLLLKGLDILVIDEADRMLDKTFRAQLEYIHSTLRGDRQTLLFSASFGEWIESVTKIFSQKDPVLLRSSSAGKPVTTLKQKVFFLNQSQKENRLQDELKKIKGGVIIFADSQESCMSLGRFLEHKGYASEFAHGNMNPGHRNRILREFRESKIQILVTTDMLARGLDIPTIECVINYDLPYKAEDFLHRIGRTARAGQEGHSTTFITPTDGRTYRRIKQYLEGATEEHLMKNFDFVDR